MLSKIRDLLSRIRDWLFGPKYMSAEEEAECELIMMNFRLILSYRRFGTITEEQYQKEKAILVEKLNNVEMKYS